MRRAPDENVAAVPLLATTMLIFTLVASTYHDLIADKYKRYEFLPIVFAIDEFPGIRWKARASMR